MPSLWNGTPMAISGVAFGREYVFPPNKIVAIGTHRGDREVVPGEDVAAHLIAQLAPRGLRVLSDQNPHPTDEDGRLSLDAFLEFVDQQIENLNSLNLRQASEGKSVIMPAKEIQEMRERAESIRKGGKAIVDKQALENLASKSMMNALLRVQQIHAALEVGDVETAKMLAAEKAPTPVEAADEAMSGGTPAITMPERKTGGKLARAAAARSGGRK